MESNGLRETREGKAMLLDLISSAPQYRMLLAAMAKRGWPAQMTGLGHIHKAAVTAALSSTAGPPEAETS